MTRKNSSARLGAPFPPINHWERIRAMPSPLALEKIERLPRRLGNMGKALDREAFEEERCI